MKFIRRRLTGLVFTLVRSQDLGERSMVPVVGATTVTPIHPEWELVVVEEPVPDFWSYAIYRVGVRFPR